MPKRWNSTCVWALAALATLAILAAAPAAAISQEPSGELLRNPGFNEDADGNGLPDGWSLSRDRVKWREKVYMGQDYEIVSLPGAYVLATQPLKLKPGQRYTITLTLKGEDGALGGALILHGKERPTREMPVLWNVQPTGQYEQYVGTFVAPDPVAAIYLYNVARRGTIYYDHVSLREGEPDRPMIGQLSLKPIDRPVSGPIELPHIDWASPLAGGPVKTFFTIRTFLCSRDLVDLSQRLDLDYDAIHTGYNGDECVSQTGRRAMNEPPSIVAFRSAPAGPARSSPRRSGSAWPPAQGW